MKLTNRINRLSPARTKKQPTKIEKVVFAAAMIDVVHETLSRVFADVDSDDLTTDAETAAQHLSDARNDLLILASYWTKLQPGKIARTN